MSFTLHISIVLIAFTTIHAYWDPARNQIENPQNDVICDNRYCKTLPDYMNWRAKVDAIDLRYITGGGGSGPIRATRNGPVEGFNVPGFYDFSTFVNVFLGIPYAKPPINEDRFKPAQKLPESRSQTYDATFYRPACPQIDDFIQDDIPNFSYTNEDCLHINVFQPNRTTTDSLLQSYPVLVFIHGGMYRRGSAIKYPGVVLAQRDMVVVTFNYRLGPLGFLSTGDALIPGNMGLSDVKLALEWVQENIEYFRGRKNEVTIVGHEAGAAIVGILMVSTITRNAGLFQRAIMMSGSDLSQWAVIPKYKYPGEYARALSRVVGCGDEPGDGMIRCLRSKHPMDLVYGAEKVPLRVGETAGPFAPVVDNYENQYIGWLDDMPAELRKKPENIMNIDVMGGFAKDDGAYILQKNFSYIFNNIQSGVSVDEFRTVVMNITRRRGARDTTQVSNAIEFLYTWWVNPDNSTARRKMLVETLTDELYASGVDLAMKSHARRPNGRKAFMYKYDYRSEKDSPVTYWMGSYFNYDVQYLFGWPYMNKTYQALMSIRIDRPYSDLDKNISNGTMRMWKDFAIYGNPTFFILNEAMPWNFRNLTWYPMNISNLTYFQLNYNSTNEKEYHQSQLAFWQDYIYDILYLEPYTTTPIFQTTYPYIQYQIASFTLGGLLLVALIAIGAMATALHRSGRLGKRTNYY